jgi:AcrR family transcriptional regulator
MAVGKSGREESGERGKRSFGSMQELLDAFFRETGVEVSAARAERYRRQRLIPPPLDKEGEERYSQVHLERLKMIEHLRGKYGMTVKDIAGIIGVMEMVPEHEPGGEASKKERDVSRREQIIRSASLLFESKGFDGTTIDDIVQAAGIAKGTFYIYFPNKDELLTQVIRRLIEDTLEVIEEKLEGEKDFFNRLLIKGSELTRLYLEKTDLLNVMIGQTVGKPQLSQHLQEIYRNLADMVVDDLRAGIEEGQLVELEDLQTAAYALIGMGQMVAYALALNRDLDPEKAISVIYLLVRRALSKNPPET